MLIFLKPSRLKLLFFSLLVLIMPTPHLMHQCATQISCEVWVWRFELNPSLLNFVVGGYAENLDVFLGVAESYFYTNDIGLLLLFAYYFIACGLLVLINRWLQAFKFFL